MKKIISGGQTGVDRAALDFAIAQHIPHGGYCPKGRKAEDGALPARYQLTETESDRYEERTEMNVVESDGTLILSLGKLKGGTALTAELCLKHLKPVHILDISKLSEGARAEFRQWVDENAVRELNVAGSRESKEPIYEIAKAALEFLFQSHGIQ